MAAALGHAVVAEGVETTTQAEMLRLLGCGYAQGFLWSAPLPADRIANVAYRIERDADSGSYRESCPRAPATHARSGEARSSHE